MTSSIYKQNITLQPTPILAGTNILSSDINVTRAQVSPGGGGLLRIAMSMDFLAVNPTITVTNGGNLVGALVTETGGIIQSDTIYTFFLVVEEPDALNFQSNRNINAVNIFRVHLLQNL